MAYTLNAPIKIRTYDVVPNVAVAQQASAVATNRRLARLMVATLVELGAVVSYSCDGVTAGTAGDGVDRWDADADIVFADGSSAHSWVVLDLGAGYGDMQLLVRCLAGGGTGNLDVYMTPSGWTGGSTTADPEPVDGDDTPLQMSSLEALLPTSNYAATIHGVAATDGSCFRLVVMDDATDAAIQLVLLETHYDGPSDYPYPQGGTWTASDDPELLSNSANVWHAFTTDNEHVASGAMAAPGGGNGTLLNGFVPKLTGDGKLHLVGCGGYDSTYGWLGYVPDLWWAVDDESVYTSIPVYMPGGEFGSFQQGFRWMCFGSVVFPWDAPILGPGGTDLGGPELNAHAVGFSTPEGAPLLGGSASITDPDPASGSELEGARSAVAFTVHNPYGASYTLWVRFARESRAFVVYDTGRGFFHPFTNSTLDDSDPDNPRFSLVQSGGWQDDVAELDITGGTGSGGGEGGDDEV